MSPNAFRMGWKDPRAETVFKFGGKIPVNSCLLVGKHWHNTTQMYYLCIKRCLVLQKLEKYTQCHVKHWNPAFFLHGKNFLSHTWNIIVTVGRKSQLLKRFYIKLGEVVLWPQSITEWVNELCVPNFPQPGRTCFVPVSNSFLLFARGKWYNWDKTRCIVGKPSKCKAEAFPVAIHSVTVHQWRRQHASWAACCWAVSCFPWEHVWLIRMLWWKRW